MTDSAPPLERIPVTDIAPFLDGDAAAKQRVAADVAAACETTGLLVISGHGMAQATIDAAITRVRSDSGSLPSRKRM